MNANKAKVSNDLYILIDGENIDRTLGSILGRAPRALDRPRWEKVIRFAESTWSDSTVKPCFFHNVTMNIPMPFIQALAALGFRSVLLTADAEGQKVVDIGIQRTMNAIAKREGDVLLMSHDGDFCGVMSALNDGHRRLGVLVFKEYLAGGYDSIENLEVFDIEYDAEILPDDNPPLYRLVKIPVSSFDPEALLDSF